jgi:methylated-DNA-protein-cysteine methyltransferase-like protein
MTDSNFFNDVYDVVRLIPPGRVTTYGAIAKYLGAARSSRMVGWAMNASHTQPDIPAHRVVNRHGMLTGKMMFTYPMQMQELLEAEGVRVVNDRVVEFARVLWEPGLDFARPPGLE